MHENLVVELVFQLEVSTPFDALKLHAFERTINLVLVELCLKEFGDVFEHFGLEFLAGGNKLVVVALVEQHIKPLERERVQWLWHLVSWQGFGSTQHLFESMLVHTRGGQQILFKRIITPWMHVNVLPVVRSFIPKYLADKEGDCAIEVFLLSAIFTLASSFGLIFKRFREVCVCVCVILTSSRGGLPSNAVSTAR
jgi:hypothetical protein